MKEVSKEITIDADAETVWKAVSEGEELKRWFPLDARVTPGEGGAVWMSFGEGMDWEVPITIWEPNRRLQTTDPAPSKLAVDYYIESQGGQTVLRIVHSGFAEDAWDDELDTLSAGWRTFAVMLKHYIERHRGEPRTMAHFRHPVVPLERKDAYARLISALGLEKQELREGGSYSIALADGVRLEGEIRVLAPPVNLSGTVRNLDDAFLMIEMEPGKGQCRPSMWLSLYGEAGREAERLRQSIQRTLESIFTAHS